MKKLAIVVVLSLATIIGSYAQMLSQGTKELDISGNFDPKGAAGTQIWTALGFGYFVADNLELAVAGAFIYDDYEIGYHPAVGAQYNFDLGCKLVPFIGLNLGWGIWDYKDVENTDGFVYGGEVGVKYFITESLALSASIDYDLSTGDIWMEKDGKMVDNNWGVAWGLRYFFI
ncbi:MAG: hypothetical protein KJ964_12030 [Verrucomicrobia bacterium]|nr:hypothetical protein [Verrucomicrobiota bacterium]MBU1735333.1 hypothetical protein [Verrucomicrobiota bacterium]MBU1855484.1 hypothetical protein [Verrucomicrobiota bacterium]